MSYSGKTKSDNGHLADLTSARFVNVGPSTSTTVRATSGRLIRVVLNTNGGVITIKNGTGLIASIAADAPEGTFDYGIYCDNSIKIETGATVDCTVVFSD